jgi:Zn-dependent M28 family amino/carboxypeptidase
MLVAYSRNRRARPEDPAIAAVLRDVSAEKLLAYVDLLAFPRHYLAEKPANVRARDLLIRLLRGFGCTPALQGTYDNIIVTAGNADAAPVLLLGAHYDSVPGTPGADDNASAVALCLECARLLQAHRVGSTMIVLFNREEDGLLGSRDFVEHLAQPSVSVIEEAHVFEMVGFCNHAANSQRMPPGLPLALAPRVGNFLGLLANRQSNAIAERLLTLAATYVPQLPVAALKICFGLEKRFGHLLRSDHAPFWEAGKACVMWTDTSEFRNPHYHRSTDTPDTLDYAFLARVTQLVLARALSRASFSGRPS